MKLTVNLSQQELNQIISEHLFGGQDVDVKIDFTTQLAHQEAKAVETEVSGKEVSGDSFSEWYFVPETHKIPYCPIKFSEKDLKIKFRNGRVELLDKSHRFRSRRQNIHWVQDCHQYDIVAFRIKNPESEWLEVSEHHELSQCPLKLGDDTQVEFVLESGFEGVEIAFMLDWSQRDAFTPYRIQKFRIVK
jgi:hypothetical protein